MNKNKLIRKILIPLFIVIFFSLLLKNIFLQQIEAVLFSLFCVIPYYMIDYRTFNK